MAVYGGWGWGIGVGEEDGGRGRGEERGCWDSRGKESLSGEQAHQRTKQNTTKTKQKPKTL